MSNKDGRGNATVSKKANTAAAPRFDPAPWNAVAAEARKSPRALNNCYAYFLQDHQRTWDDSFPQPGALAAVRAQMNAQRRDQYTKTLGGNGGAMMPETKPYRCDSLIDAIRADNPLIFTAARYQACPHNYYKGFLAVDNSKAADSDYHFWILNDDGHWSHKPGGNEVTARDWSGNAISDPISSDRGRYNQPCAFFCVPANEFAPTFSTGLVALNNNNKK